MEMDNNSIGAFSFFENDVMGIFSNDKGNYVLGRVAKQNNLYVLYNDADLKVSHDFQCGVDDEMQNRFLDNGLDMKIDELLAEPEFSQVACEKTVNVYFETDYEMYQDLGNSTTAVNNYVTGMFNVMKTIYENENINTAISQIFVWSTQDPYPTTGSGPALYTFGATRQDNFNGDLAHLLSTNNNGLGGRAWIGVLCSSYSSFNDSGRFAYTNINTFYSNFPTYSWTVSASTHEMGHNLGSRHTHNCDAWANGPIDWCGPTYDSAYIEGNCSPVANPSSGTIMSCLLYTSDAADDW